MKPGLASRVRTDLADLVGGLLPYTTLRESEGAARYVYQLILFFKFATRYNSKGGQ